MWCHWFVTEKLNDQQKPRIPDINKQYDKPQLITRFVQQLGDFFKKEMQASHDLGLWKSYEQLFKAIFANKD